MPRAVRCSLLFLFLQAAMPTAIHAQTINDASHRRVKENLSITSLFTLQERIKAYSQNEPKNPPPPPRTSPDESLLPKSGENKISQSRESERSQKRPGNTDERPDRRPKPKDSVEKASSPNGIRGVEPPDNPEKLLEIYERLMRNSAERSRRQVSEGRGNGQGLVVPEGLGDRIGIPKDLIANLANHLQNQELNTWYAEYWNPAVRKAAEMMEPFRGHAAKLLERIEETGGKIMLRLPSLSNLNAPNLGMGGASPGDSMKVLGVFLVVAVGAVVFIVFLKSRNDGIVHADESTPTLSWERVPPEEVRNRADFVRAIDTLALERWGLGSRWWTHGRVADAFSDLRLANAGGAFEMADLYEFARYAPFDRAFSAEQIEQARNALRRLS